MHPAFVCAAHHLEALLSRTHPHKHTQTMSTSQTWHSLITFSPFFKHTDNFDLRVVDRLSNFSSLRSFQLSTTSCMWFISTNKQTGASVAACDLACFLFFFVFVVYFESGHMLIVEQRLCLRSRNNNSSSGSEKPGRIGASQVEPSHYWGY